MFLTYIEFFHKLHTKHLKRFSNKIQLMYTHISTDIKFDETIDMNKEKKKEVVVDDFTSDIQSNNKIIADEESVKLINDILESNDDKSVGYNNTPVSSSNNSALFIEETQITDENVYDNFKNISQSCDNLLSKDNIEITANIDNKATTEVSDISDDVSVMSEFIIDEPENTNTIIPAAATKPKPTRGRKKKN
jgi:hypothetical protein